jgi:hypothetical protein
MNGADSYHLLILNHLLYSISYSIISETIFQINYGASACLSGDLPVLKNDALYSSP